MGVRHVVRGSLRQEGTSIHLNLALVDGDNGVQRWAETFAIERAQLTQAVGDFAVAIERTLTPALYRTSVERRAAMSPTQVTADDLAMQGYALWYRGVSRENVLAARALFERALTLDPNSVRAWNGIQFTTFNQLMNNWTDDPAATIRRAEDVVTNLERLDPDGSQTYSAKTFKLFRQRDFPRCCGSLPSGPSATGCRWPSAPTGRALTVNGRFDEAVPAIERALRLGPRDPFRAEWQYRLALAHFGAGRYELARDWSQSRRQHQRQGCCGRRCTPRRCNGWAARKKPSRRSTNTCGVTRVSRRRTSRCAFRATRRPTSRCAPGCSASLRELGLRQ